MVHELRKLTAPKEIPDHSRKSFGIDELLWSHGIQPLIKESHPLFNQTLGSSEPHSALVGKQLTDRSYATASEMIDVVQSPLTFLETEQIFGSCDQIFLFKNA